MEKISKKLTVLSNRYPNWDRGGCGYIAQYIYQNLIRQNISSEIRLFCRFKSLTAPYVVPDIILFTSEYDKYRDYINFSHVINKTNNGYLDLNGLKTENELFIMYGYDQYQITSSVLNHILIHAKWNPTFNKRDLFRIKRDINLAFKREKNC